MPRGMTWPAGVWCTAEGQTDGSGREGASSGNVGHAHRRFRKACKPMWRLIDDRRFRKACKPMWRLIDDRRFRKACKPMWHLMDGRLFIDDEPKDR